MFGLEKKLKNWVSLGLISQDQAQSISHHESSSSGNSWILSGLLILGAAIIGIGIISLVASNWNHIPDIAKLLCDFTLLILVVLWILKAWEAQKKIQFEALLLFFLILCLASIGLISQVFQTGGELYQALMLWSLITFPAVLVAQKILIPFLWTGIFLVGAIFTALNFVPLQFIFKNNHLAIFMDFVLLCPVFMIISKMVSGEVSSTRAFRAWTLVGGLISLIIVEWYRLIGNADFLLHSGIILPYSPGYFFAAFIAFSILRDIDYSGVQKLIVLSILVLFLILFHLPFFGITSSLVYASFTIIELILMAIFIASLQEKFLFQILLLILGLRFLMLYFQAIGGLAQTGVGLIVSGCVVIGIAILWNKYRESFFIWIKELLR